MRFALICTVLDSNHLNVLAITSTHIPFAQAGKKTELRLRVVIGQRNVDVHPTQ